jgi:hypothetical protein
MCEQTLGYIERGKGREARQQAGMKDVRCLLGMPPSIGLLILENIRKCLLLLKDDLLSENRQVYLAAGLLDVPYDISILIYVCSYYKFPH